MDVISEESLAQEIDSLRRLLRMNVREYSALMGLSPAAYGKLIEGRTPTPLFALVKLCRALNFPMSLIAQSVPSKKLKRGRGLAARSRRARREI